MSRPPDRTAARRRGGLAAGVRGDPAPGRAGRRPTATTHTFASERLTIEPFDLTDPVRTEPGHRPARLLVLPPARVAEEGRAGQRHLPAQQPVHVPVDGEAQRLLRDDPARPQGAARPCWCPTRTRSTTSRWAYTSAKYNQPFDLDAIAERARLPAVHEAVRRRRLARRLADRRPRRPAPGLRRVRRDAHAPAGHRRLRALRPGAVDRPRDDGDGLPARRSRCTSGTPCRHDFLSPSPPARGGGDQPDRQRVLPLGVQLLRDAGRRRRGLPDRLRQRLPRRRGDLAALLLPVGDHGAGALVGLLRWSPGARPRSTCRPRRYFAIADDPSLDYDEKLDGLPRAGRRALRDRALPRVLRDAPARTSTRQVLDWVTSRRLRPAAARHRARRPTRRTSRSSSSPTSAACSACGWPTSPARDATSCGISSGEMPQDVASRRSGQGGGDHLAGLVLDLGQVLGAAERLGVDLVDVLGARRPGGEPGVLGGHLEPADLGAVAGRRGELGGDRLAGQLGRGDVVGRERGQLGLLLAVGRGVDARVRRVAVLGDQVGVVLARASCR